MAGKRKADDNLTGKRRRASRTNTTAGDNLAGTSAQTSGPTANAAGGGIAGTSQALAGLTAATTGSAGGSSQFGGARGGVAWSGQRGRGFAPPHRQTFPGQTAFSVGGAARGAGGGAGYRGFSQPPSQGMLRPPLGNPAGGRSPFTYGQNHNHAGGPRQMPSQGMLRPPLGNPAGGRPPFTYDYEYHNQIPFPLQTGTGQPRGHSGSGGLSWAISCPSAPGAPVPVSPLVDVEACPRCKRPPTIVFGGCAPFCVDCYAKIVLDNVLEKHPEIRYVHPPPGASSSSSSSSSSAVGSDPICPACGHPSGTGNRACSVCQRNGPPPPGLG